MKLKLYFDTNDIFVITNEKDINEVISAINGETSKKWLKVHYKEQLEITYINIEQVRLIDVESEDK